MVPLKDVIEKLNLVVVTPGANLDRQVSGGYASDLLSCAMGKAKKDQIWVTLQSHMNIVAVGSLLGLAAIIITEGSQPDNETIARAESEDVPLLTTSLGNFETIGRLYNLSIPGETD